VCADIQFVTMAQAGTIGYELWFVDATGIHHDQIPTVVPLTDHVNPNSTFTTGPQVKVYQLTPCFMYPGLH
jgi:hypothetical protein